MNIKWALEAPDAAIYISIYAQVRKQPRTRCREIDSPQKQADSFKRVERAIPLTMMVPPSKAF